MSLLVVGGFLTASSGSDVAAEDEAEARSKKATSPQAALTGIEASTNPSRILFRADDGVTNSARLHLMDPNGSIVFTHTTIGTYPSWHDLSPDGSHVVYISSTAEFYGGAMVTMNADGSNEHVIDQTSLDYMPSWSPDNSKIAFSKYIEANSAYSIMVMNADGTNQVVLTTGAVTGDFWPDWSPDGTKIVYSHEFNQLYVMNADGSNQHPITTGYGSYPAWSPDGTMIAYFANEGLTLARPDGTNSHVISSMTGRFPSWSPDGNWIAFEISSDGNYSDLYKINIDSSSIITLTNTSNLFELAPSWGGSSLTTIKVEGEDGLAVPGAQVFRNCELVGLTSVTGTLVLTRAVALNDELVARAAVYTGTTQKADHDGWAYQVWLTNLDQNSDGAAHGYMVTDTTRITHTLKLLPTNAQIGINLVASVEYNTTEDHLDQLTVGFVKASDFLMDVTDGQMFFENVKVYEDNQHWNDADVQFGRWHPRADADAEPDGLSALTSPSQHIRMHGPDEFGTPYNQPSAYSTLIHEFGHYDIGAYDEYYKYNADDFPAQCTVTFENVDYTERASIMYQQRKSSEFCSSIFPTTHNDETSQGYIQGESVWQTFVDNWSSDEDLWELRSPMTRGEIDFGPLFTSCTTMGTDVTVVNVPGGSCSPITVLVTKDGEPVVGAYITVKHSGQHYMEGTTDAFGSAKAVGAFAGDTIIAGAVIGGVPHYGTEAVVNCADDIVIELTNTTPRSGGHRGGAVSPQAWPVSWLKSSIDWATNTVSVTLQVASDPPSQPTMFASQGANNRQAVALTYNSGLHQYTGTYTFNPALSPNFSFEVVKQDNGSEIAEVYQALGGQFQNTGPRGYEKMKNRGEPHGNNPEIAPISWGLLRAESMADVIVKPTSLPNGTGVMVAESGMPSASPTGLQVVGGPYSVEGQNAIVGDVGITLSYLSEYYCGLVPGSEAIYRFTGSGWEAMPTTALRDWHQAGGKITQWGIYGVFAQLNPLALSRMCLRGVRSTTISTGSPAMR